MAPTQVAVLPVSDDKHGDYATEIMKQLGASGVRAKLLTGDSLGKRIRIAKTDKIPYQIVIGDKELESQTLTIEGRNDLKLEDMTAADFITRITSEITERTLN